MGHSLWLYRARLSAGISIWVVSVGLWSHWASLEDSINTVSCLHLLFCPITRAAAPYNATGKLSLLRSAFPATEHSAGMASSVQLPGTGLTFAVDSTTSCGQDFPAGRQESSEEIRGGFLSAERSCSDLKTEL